MSTTLDRVVVIVAKQLDCDPSELDASTDLEAAGYESLDVIETIFAVEEEFGVDIEYNANVDDPDALKTVGGLVNLIEESLKKQRPA